MWPDCLGNVRYQAATSGQILINWYIAFLRLLYLWCQRKYKKKWKPLNPSNNEQNHFMQNSLSQIDEVRLLISKARRQQQRRSSIIHLKVSRQEWIRRVFPLSPPPLSRIRLSRMRWSWYSQLVSPGVFNLDPLTSQAATLYHSQWLKLERVKYFIPKLCHFEFNK